MNANLTPRRGFAKVAALLLALVAVLSLGACHGSAGLPTFEVPQEWDETRTYELTFWAKNDTNKAQTKVYEDAIANFQSLIPT